MTTPINPNNGHIFAPFRRQMDGIDVVLAGPRNASKQQPIASSFIPGAPERAGLLSYPICGGQQIRCFKILSRFSPAKIEEEAITLRCFRQYEQRWARCGLLQRPTEPVGGHDRTSITLRVCPHPRTYAYAKNQPTPTALPSATKWTPTWQDSPTPDHNYPMLHPTPRATPHSTPDLRTPRTEADAEELVPTRYRRPSP